MNEITKIEEITSTVLVIANIKELVTSVVMKISGNDISNSINGELVNKNLIGILTEQFIVNHLNEAKKRINN